MRRLIPFALLLALFLTGCSTVSGPSGEEGGPFAGRSPDGGPSNPPDLSQVPDAVPRDEPRARYGNPARYEVFGQTYYVKDSAEGYDQEGIASWYGTKFHGRRTSSGEPYDMYAMTAAHRSLPLPTYAEVTNLDNGKRVVVRINDRGPFVDNRIIDLSYAAATRLDMVDAGTAPVRVRTVTAADSCVPPAPGTVRPPATRRQRPPSPMMTGRTPRASRQWRCRRASGWWSRRARTRPRPPPIPPGTMGPRRVAVTSCSSAPSARRRTPAGCVMSSTAN